MNTRIVSPEYDNDQHGELSVEPPVDFSGGHTADHHDDSPDLSDALPSNHRSGFVAVIGRPNVGKSTLLNRLLGQKLAITSPKPQTTRDQLLGILTEAEAQIMFLDTPGIHKPKHKLGEYMVAVAEETIRDVDLVLWLVDINTIPTEEDLVIASLLQDLHSRKALPPLLLGLNQTDRWTGDEVATAARIEDYRQLVAWIQPQVGLTQTVAAMHFSAKQGIGTDRLLAHLRQQLPLGPRYYPDDQVTDMQTRFIAAELIREQALHLLEQEVPHGIAVEVDEFTERDETMTYISAVIYVERQSQKSIVLGEGGRMIKAIGQAARPAIEELVGTRVYLELWVKVWEKWRKRSGMLRQLGYAMQK